MFILTQHIDAKVRATVISTCGQIDAFGQIVGGPPVGYLGNMFSIQTALLASCALLSPVLFLYAYAARKSGEKLSQPS
jgi:DHA3 family tetracycline resistance protein-like MFS transporter